LVSLLSFYVFRYQKRFKMTKISVIIWQGLLALEKAEHR
jgi:hypothetical protein